MCKIGRENVQLKIKTVKSIPEPISLFLVVAKIGSKCILSVSNFTRQRLNSFNVLALVSLFVKVCVKCLKHVNVDVVNDEHIILIGLGSHILSCFKVIKRGSKPFVRSEEGEKAGVNRVKFEIEYHTITLNNSNQGRVRVYDYVGGLFFLYV